jgi:hypothetical protein
MGTYSGHPAKRIRLLLLVLGMLIVDLRRAIDVLEVRPDVKTDQLAYFGVSYGAAMGGLSAEVEDRIKASVLAVDDGGLVSHFAGPDDTDGPLQALPARGAGAVAAGHAPEGHDGVACPPHPHRPHPIQVPTLTAAPGLEPIRPRKNFDHPVDHPDDPSGSVWSHWTDEASNVSRLDPSGAVQVDAERPSHDRKVAAISSASLTRRPFAVCWWGPGARHPSLGVAWTWAWRPAAQRVAPTPRDFRAGNAELGAVERCRAVGASP